MAFLSESRAVPHINGVRRHRSHMASDRHCHTKLLWGSSRLAQVAWPSAVTHIKFIWRHATPGQAAWPTAGCLIQMAFLACQPPLAHLQMALLGGFYMGNHRRRPPSTIQMAFASVGRCGLATHTNGVLWRLPTVLPYKWTTMGVGRSTARWLQKWRSWE
jgi:hypothetical protein